MKLGRLTLFAAVLIVFLSLPYGVHAQVNIIGTLSNFDVVNDTGIVVNDFKITIFGIKPSAITHTYPNPKYGPPSLMGVPPTPTLPRNTIVKYGPRSGIVTQHGETEHFGVVLSGNPLRPTLVRFDWTRDNQPVTQGGDPNLPQQRWDPTRNRVIDVIRNNTWRQPRRLFVQRRVARRAGRIPLEDLQRNSALFEQGIRIDPNPVLLDPEAELAFDDSFFDVFVVAPDVETLVMMYDVFDVTASGGPGKRIGTMLNAVWVQFAAPPVTVVDWLSNFDVVNRTGIRVNDFRIIIFGITPNDVIGTYTNPNYGQPTITGQADGTVIKYGPTGTYFTPVGGVEHFGVRLRGNPIPLPPRIRFDWTLNGQPVTQGGDPNMPIQVWNPVTNRMVDIIRNVTWRNPRRLFVQRRVNRRDAPIRLEEMLRDNGLFAQAQRIDEAPVPLEPDQDLMFNDSFFDVFAELPAVQGVMLGYDVFDEQGQPIGTMINAANVGLVPLRTIKGSIKVEDCDPAQLPLRARFHLMNGPPDSFFDVFFALNADGTFSLPDIPAGKYSVQFKAMNSLGRSRQVDITTNDAVVENVFLETGDANDDNSVDVLDLDELIQAFDADPTAPNWNAGRADFNGDDSVDVLDLDILIRNFDKTGDD